MTEPTDEELAALRTEFGITSNGRGIREFTQVIGFARAVLAKWGTPPAVVGEQVGWMWQHYETGWTGFVDCWQVENRWQEGNPRLRLISKLYATPQPTQAQAGAVPLTKEQAASLCKMGPVYAPDGRVVRTPEQYRRELEGAKLAGIRTAERAHGIGIKGGQHG